MKGRRPKPTALKRLEGNPGKRKLNGKEPKFKDSPAGAPAWLSAAAKKEWKRLAPELISQKLLTIADRNLLAAYCQAYENWKAAEKVVRDEGMTFETPQGCLQQRPEVSIAQRERASMLRFAVELGLSPAARARLHVGGGEGDDEEEDNEFFRDRPADAARSKQQPVLH